MTTNATRVTDDAADNADIVEAAKKWAETAGAPANVEAAEKSAAETAERLKRAMDVNPELLRAPVTL